jgi:hypothetical protein
MNALIARLGSYRKSVTALVTGWLGWGVVVVASASGPITAAEWLQLGIVTATAAGVYAVTNQPTEPAPDAGAVDIVSLGIFLLLVAIAAAVLVHVGLL